MTIFRRAEKNPVFTRRFTLLVTWLLGITAFLSAVGLCITSTTINIPSLIIPLVSSLVMFGLAVLYRRRDPVISDLCQSVGWMVLISNLFNLPMFAIARLKPPFQDATLVAIDQWFRIEIPDILALQSRFPISFTIINSSYNLLLPLIMLAIVLPTACGQGKQVREFFIALMMSGVIGFSLFYLFPAAGWFDHYHATPRPEHRAYLDTIRNVWDQETFEIDMGYRAGLIYFPSFHTILPILSLFSLRRIPFGLLCATPIAVLIILSTMTTGHHYPCDIYAGIFVALVSWWIASKVEPHLSGEV